MNEVRPASSKYHAEIRDARGVVIGDKNVVYQYFLDTRYRPLAEHLITFDDLIADRTADFVGRDFLDAQLASFMEQHSRGYFVVVGEPGVGKTAWAAHVVREQQALHHFNVSALGVIRPDQCLENLCAQIIVRFQLEQPYLPVSVGRDGSLLDKLLRHASERLGNDKLLIVIDALDEVQMPTDVRSTNILYLPPSLPVGVYCVLTRRPQPVPLETAPETPSETFALGAGLPNNQADVRAYLQQQVSRAEFAVRLTERHIPTERFIAELAERSAGNFMYLAYLLPDIANGLLDPLNLTDLPRGLRSYYERFWNELESAKGEGREAWTRFYRPVIGVLAVVREPVSAGWIGQVLALDPVEVTDYALTRWEKYLYHTRSASVDVWRIYHTSFRDFLMGMLNDLVQSHDRIIRYYERFWRQETISLDDYGLRHLPYHYVQAAQPEKLKALVESPFLRRKRDRFGLSPVMNDITLAQRAMIDCGECDGLLYLFLLESAIHEHESAGFPPFRLALLALESDWDGAVDRAVALIDPEQRVLALACIAVTCALTGRRGGGELLDRCEDIFLQMNRSAAGRAVVRVAGFVAIFDYQRAFGWLLRLEPGLDKSQSIHDDPGLCFTTALLLLRRKEINLLAEAVADLWQLLKDGNDDFSGLESPYDFMPPWLYDVYCQIVPWAVETRHVRLLAMLPAAYRCSGERSLAPFVTALERLDTEGIVDVTRLLLHSPTTIQPILQPCASLLVRREPTGWSQFLSMASSTDWHNTLTEQAIRCKAIPPEIGWSDYLAQISDAGTKLDVVLFLLTDCAVTLTDESTAELIALAGQLLYSSEDAGGEAWRSYATMRLTMLERKQARAQALAELWNELASAGKDCSTHPLLTWFLDTDPAFTVSMLSQPPAASRATPNLWLWAKVAAHVIPPDVRAQLAAWLHRLLAAARESLNGLNETCEDLLHTLAFIDPSAAFQMRSMISHGRRSWIVGDCGITAARMGDLNLLEQVTIYMDEIDRRYQNSTYLPAFLRDIYVFQPEFVMTTIDKLRSSTSQSQCIIHVARSLLPEDLAGSWRLASDAQVSSFFPGLSVAGYSALEDSSNLCKAEALFGQGVMGVRDPLRLARQLHSIDLTPAEHDVILEHLISRENHSDRSVLLELHRMLSRGTRPILRVADRSLWSRIDLAYFDLAVSDDPVQGLAALNVPGLEPSIAREIGDYLFWVALLAGCFEVAGAVTSRWPYAHSTAARVPYVHSDSTEISVADYASMQIVQRSASRGCITLGEAITALKMLLPDDTRVATAITAILRVRKPSVTPELVHALADAGLLLTDGDESNLLPVLVDLAWEGDEVADLLWQCIPHQLIMSNLLVQIVNEMAATRSALLDEVIEYVIAQPRLGAMLADLAEKPVLDHGALRRLLEQEMANIESLRCSGQEDWWWGLEHIARVAPTILDAGELGRLAESFLIAATEDHVRHDYILKYACILMSADDPTRALEIAEPLINDVYLSPLSGIARVAPKAVFDFVLARERSRQGETIFLGGGNSLFHPFMHALEKLALSPEQLRVLKGQVEIVSTIDDPQKVLDALLVTRLLEDGEIEQAIKHVENECPEVALTLVPALVAAARWDDIGRVLVSVKDYDVNLYDGVLCKVVEEIAIAQPERALGYLEQIQDPDDRFKALECILDSAVQSGIRASSTKDVFDQMIQAAYSLNNTSAREALRRTLSSGLEVLPPLSIAGAMVGQKDYVPPTVEETVRWAERAYSEDSPDQVIAKIRRASDMVARHFDRSA